MYGRRRRRGGNLGGIHLLFFLMRYLPRLAEVKPLVTLLLGGVMFGAQYGLLPGPLEYLAYAPASQVCLAPAAVVYGDQFSRILTGMLRHTSDYHLFFTLGQLAQRGLSMEPRLGSENYGKMIFAVSILTQIAICISAIALSTITRDDSWAVDCYIGFAPVLFALKPLGGPQRVSFFGMQMPSFEWSLLFELGLMHVLIPQSSLFANVIGLATGFAFASATAGSLGVPTSAAAGVWARYAKMQLERLSRWAAGTGNGSAGARRAPPQRMQPSAPPAPTTSSAGQSSSERDNHARSRAAAAAAARFERSHVRRRPVSAGGVGLGPPMNLH
jgi:membrane associated rhomboid family serine protease